ncbi:MAG TPA: hypothetical protein VMF89_19910, partial [Polyangiales bacterium]|nr:hypothetical protein [Polyangiales bacterium]
MRLRVLARMLVAGLAACGGNTDDPNGNSGPIVAAPGAPGSNQATTGSVSAGPTGSAPSSGVGALPAPAGSTTPGATQPSAPVTSTNSGASVNGLPCDVSAILKAKCQ